MSKRYLAWCSHTLVNFYMCCLIVAGANYNCRDVTCLLLVLTLLMFLYLSLYAFDNHLISVMMTSVGRRTENDFSALIVLGAKNRQHDKFNLL